MLNCLLLYFFNIFFSYFQTTQTYPPYAVPFVVQKYAYLFSLLPYLTACYRLDACFPLLRADTEQMSGRYTREEKSCKIVPEVQFLQKCAVFRPLCRGNRVLRRRRRGRCCRSQALGRGWGRRHGGLPLLLRSTIRTAALAPSIWATPPT